MQLHTKAMNGSATQTASMRHPTQGRLCPGTVPGNATVALTLSVTAIVVTLATLAVLVWMLMTRQQMLVGSHTAEPAAFDGVGIEEAGFASQAEAAAAFGRRYGSRGLALRIEYQSAIVRVDDREFGYTSPAAGPVGADLIDISDYWRALRAHHGTTIVALVHNHFDANQYFSRADVETAQRIPLYLFNSRGETRYLDEELVTRRIRHESGPSWQRLASYMNGNDNGFPGRCTSGCRLRSVGSAR